MVGKRRASCLRKGQPSSLPVWGAPAVLQFSPLEPAVRACQSVSERVAERYLVSRKRSLI